MLRANSKRCSTDAACCRLDYWSDERRAIGTAPSRRARMVAARGAAERPLSDGRSGHCSHCLPKQFAVEKGVVATNAAIGDSWTLAGAKEAPPVAASPEADLTSNRSSRPPTSARQPSPPIDSQLPLTVL
uniref:Uncharacterized protein n=1 Tax=Plectus sambesii TaxID=2011161 RepID=A0A914V504_9BILA